MKNALRPFPEKALCNFTGQLFVKCDLLEVLTHFFGSFSVSNALRDDLRIIVIALCRCRSLPDLVALASYSLIDSLKKKVRQRV